MKTLIEAPPKRKPINWYRAGAYAMWMPPVALVALSMVPTLPYLLTSEPPSNAALDGHGVAFQALILFQMFIMMIALCLAVVLGGYYGGSAITRLHGWWSRKIREHDERAKGYHD